MRSCQILDDSLSGAGDGRENILTSDLRRGNTGDAVILSVYSQIFLERSYFRHIRQATGEKCVFPAPARLALEFSPFAASTSTAEVGMEILKILPLMHAWLTRVVTRFANSFHISSFEAFHSSGCSSATGFHSTIIHDLCINADIKHENKNKFYQLEWQTEETFPSLPWFCSLRC